MRSYYKNIQEDQQNGDETEELITIKSKSRAFDIIFYIFVVITIVSRIGFKVRNNSIFIGIGIGIRATIMIVIGIIGCFYYDKVN